jgi:multidrug efflux pump subunit AcrB
MKAYQSIATVRLPSEKTAAGKTVQLQDVAHVADAADQIISLRRANEASSTGKLSSPIWFPPLKSAVLS